MVAERRSRGRAAGFTECSTVFATGLRMSRRAMQGLLSGRWRSRDDLARAQVGDGGGRVAELAQDLVGVLAAHRGVAPDTGLHPGERERHPHHRNVAELGMLHATD